MLKFRYFFILTLILGVGFGIISANMEMHKQRTSAIDSYFKQPGDTLVVKQVILIGVNFVVMFEGEVLGKTIPSEYNTHFDDILGINPGDKLNIVFKDSINFIVKGKIK